MSILRLSTLSLTLAIAVITLGLAAVPALADPPVMGCHESHKVCNGDDDGGRDETFYDVVIGPMTATGDFIVGESDDDHPWLAFGNGTSIGLNDSSLSPPGPARPGIGEFTDLSFFANLMGGSLPFSHTQGAECFPGTTAIHEGNVREGRGGRAQAGFFFHGSTHKTVEGEFVTVLYHLLLTGTFNTLSLPPTTDAMGNPTTVILSMVTWELTATNEGQAVKSASCIGEGALNVEVTVTGPVPEVSE